MRQRVFDFSSGSADRGARRGRVAILGMLFFGCLPGSSFAQPEVELITFGPGASPFERFGHSALRVRDEERDLLYNLGQADFDSSWFFLRTVQGDAVFYGTARDGPSELARYQNADRDVRRQPLRLPEERARWLADHLDRSVGADRFEYRYDHLHRNCTTEVRDLVDEASDGRLRALVSGELPQRTFRELTLDGVSGDLPMLLGADLLTGPYHDRTPTGWEALYLPEALRRAVGAVPGLAPESVLVHRRRTALRSAPPHAGRWGVLGLSLAVLLLVVVTRARGRGHRLAGAGLVAVVLGMGFTGLGLWLLAATSRLPDLAWNENALSMWPTDLVFLGFAVEKLRGRRPVLGRAARGYLAMRLAFVAGLAMCKLAGVAVQDNVAILLASAASLIALLLAGKSARLTGLGSVFKGRPEARLRARPRTSSCTCTYVHVHVFVLVLAGRDQT